MVCTQRPKQIRARGLYDGEVAGVAAGGEGHDSGRGGLGETANRAGGHTVALVAAATQIL